MIRKSLIHTTLLSLAAVLVVGWLGVCHMVIGSVSLEPQLIEAGHVWTPGQSDFRKAADEAARSFEAGAQTGSQAASYVRISTRRVYAQGGSRTAQGHAPHASESRTTGIGLHSVTLKNSSIAPFRSRDHYVIGLRHLII